MHHHSQFEAALRLLDGRLNLSSAPAYRQGLCAFLKDFGHAHLCDRV